MSPTQDTTNSDARQFINDQRRRDGKASGQVNLEFNYQNKFPSNSTLGTVEDFISDTETR